MQHVPSQFPHCFCGNTVKTENSILELSLLLSSKKYDHIYRFGEGVKINARGVEEGDIWGGLSVLLMV